jgi:choline-sulfatase
VLKARYYGEISYIDHCLGQILDAVEARPDADNTLICFFADHGDHLGDHHGWQKQSFFEASCHVPFLVSWPVRLPADTRRDELVCLTDLFGIATHAAGTTELRQGEDVLGMLAGEAAPRQQVIGYHNEPGSQHSTMMIREGDWKYIYIANGNRAQLFNLREDPQEMTNLVDAHPQIAADLRAKLAAHCQQPELRSALDGGTLRVYPFEARPPRRIYQFDRSRGVTEFPEKPEDVLKTMAEVK